MKGVAALPQHHVHDGSAVVAKLGGKAVVLDLELLHDFNRRREVDVGVTSLTLFRSTDGTSVQGDLGGGVSLAIRDKVGASWVSQIAARGLCHPAGQIDQL